MESKPLGDSIPFELTGGTSSVSIVVETIMNLGTEGVYWIDVLLDGERVTSMPITIMLQRSGEEREPLQPPSQS
jgi:hypothetical protein